MLWLTVIAHLGRDFARRPLERSIPSPQVHRPWPCGRFTVLVCSASVSASLNASLRSPAVRVGIVSVWFNRGQATVGRQLRSALEQLGHDTFVLARPARERFVRPLYIENRDVWAQKRVTAASTREIPAAEYQQWAEANGIDAAFFFQNLQFPEIRSLRERGVVTFGCFMWEAFRAQNVDGARDAFDVVYSVNRCSHERYRSWGLHSRYLGWACHPELLAHRAGWAEGTTTFFFPGGYMRPRRKPLTPVLEAFTAVDDPALRLVVKAQTDRTAEHELSGWLSDPRIRFVVDDQPQREYYDLVSSCQVMLAPSGWEGLGIHLYEASAFGMPTITNDDPPMNELVTDGRNGRLVGSEPEGQTKSGVPAFAPRVDELSDAIRELSQRRRWAELSEGALARARDDLAWDRWTERLATLLDKGVNSA